MCDRNDVAAEGRDEQFSEEDVGGRCHAILTSGRRCPNAALPKATLDAAEANPDKQAKMNAYCSAAVSAM